MSSNGRPFITHAIAECEDCEWSEEDYKMAVKMAWTHYKKTGHQINVQTAYSKTLKRKERGGHE